MNHCILNRQLKGGTVYEGVIVTTPMGGDTTHLVYRDEDSPLFRMPATMFSCLKAGLSNTKRLRREQVLEFGDEISFTCFKGSGPFDSYVIDYEKNKSSTGKVAFIDGKYLLKTLCVLPPQWTCVNKSGAFVWTKLFGTIPVSSRAQRYMTRRAHPDVAIYCWLHVYVDQQNYTLTAEFYEFHEDGIAQEDMAVVWNTDWNIQNKPLSTKSTVITPIYESGDEEDDYEERCHLDDYAIEIGVKTRLEGVVISFHEIYCPTFPDKRVYMGLWREKDVVERSLEGYKIRFDAFYSDVINGYVAYYYECDDLAGQQLCQVHYVTNAVSNLPNSRLLTLCQLYDYTLGGFLRHDYFGLVADRKNCLRALPVMEEEKCRNKVNTKLPEHGATGRFVNVYIVDKGPSTSLARFEIDCLPKETKELVDGADEKLVHHGEISSEGFVVRQEIGQVYAYKFPTQQFFIPNDERHKIATGMWIRFKAVYMPDLVFFMIRKFEIIYPPEKPIIDCRYEEEADQSGQRHYEFKINVQHHKLVKFALFGRLYGFVSDRDKEFKANIKLKSFDVIVAQDMENSATTLFRLKRMAKPGECLTNSSTQLGKIIDLDTYSEDEEKMSRSDHYDSRSDIHNDGLDDEEQSWLTGLEQIAVEENTWNGNRLLSGVQFNSKYLRRERKMEARQRKIKRDRLARLEEAQFQCT